jgi:hypothetical protein
MRALSHTLPAACFRPGGQAIGRLQTAITTSTRRFRQGVFHAFCWMPGIVTAGAGTPEVLGQIGSPVEWIADPAAPADDPGRGYHGQRSPDGNLVLTASNGFFDKGVRAAGTCAAKDAAGSDFIGMDFGWLEAWNKPGSTLRWHLWVETPGRLEAAIHAEVPESWAGAVVTMKIGESSARWKTHASANAASPQPEVIGFDVRKTGWIQAELRLDSLTGDGVGKLHRIVLRGTAASRAAVLRARWRPAACHTKFSSSGAERPVAWVMSTRAAPDSAIDSYSPLTTPFGYFGASIDAAGRFSPRANFSLWSYRKGKPTPQQNWAHLLAVGSPQAEFGAFGHEGSGVKVRGEWEPFGRDTRELTLALRCEAAGEWNRWWGFYLDSASGRFKLYAIGSTRAGRGGGSPVLNPGAFVEQPGPPDRERSGDRVRDVWRRGWVLDQRDQWHAIDRMTTGGDPRSNKHWRPLEGGWFAMGMGGLPHRAGSGGVLQAKKVPPPPPWLAHAAEDLRKPLLEIGPRTIARQPNGALEVRFDLAGLTAGERSMVRVFHGPEDCLTFADELGFREVRTRCWAHASEPQPCSNGTNWIRVGDTDSKFLRLFVETPRGKVWAFETDATAEGAGNNGTSK